MHFLKKNDEIRSTEDQEAAWIQKYLDLADKALQSEAHAIVKSKTSKG